MPLSCQIILSIAMSKYEKCLQNDFSPVFAQKSWTFSKFSAGNCSFFMILDRKKTKIEYNSKWLKKISASKLIEISSSYSVSRMLERDDFKKRFKQNISISIREFLYPILQGYDSVELNADIELAPEATTSSRCPYQKTNRPVQA